MAVVASYNIHRGVGLDGRRDIARTSRIVKQLRADIIGLQEVECRSNIDSQCHQLAQLADATGLTAVAGPTIRGRDRGHYGNALLTAWRVLAVRRLDLSVPGREPRGALDVNLDIRGKTVRVIVTHLGLRGAERRYQVKRLITALSEEPAGLVIALSDANEWLPVGRPLRSLRAIFGKTHASRTFPSLFPLLALDRIWVRPKEDLVHIRPHKTSLARIASDHLPLKAIIDPTRITPD
ncbi:MAG: endonuclease/exonuclease/phosphatase family protein [Deltaproteobacteria bacterium]|nr:endonuclease/exonuclease/phosphatase family protein [Deltaproteobacteria bacterium]